jgi:hypothetical protein
MRDSARSLHVLAGGALALAMMAASASGCDSEPKTTAAKATPSPNAVRSARAEGIVVAAPPALRQACRKVARDAQFTVLCPSLLPENGGGFEEPKAFESGRCSYLLNLEPRGVRQSEGTLFHVLFGGRCEAWPLPTDGPGTTWPTHRINNDLRLVGTEPQPGTGSDNQPIAPLDVLATTDIRAGRAVVVRSRPYPAGGIHGGHLGVIWNANGHGYALTAHAVGSDHPKATPDAIRTLRAIAESMKPVR